MKYFNRDDRVINNQAVVSEERNGFARELLPEYSDRLSQEVFENVHTMSVIEVIN